MEGLYIHLLGNKTPLLSWWRSDLHTQLFSGSILFPVVDITGLSLSVREARYSCRADAHIFKKGVWSIGVRVFIKCKKKQINTQNHSTEQALDLTVGRILEHPEKYLLCRTSPSGSRVAQNVSKAWRSVVHISLPSRYAQRGNSYPAEASPITNIPCYRYRNTEISKNTPTNSSCIFC